MHSPFPRLTDGRLPSLGMEGWVLGCLLRLSVLVLGNSGGVGGGCV